MDVEKGVDLVEFFCPKCGHQWERQYDVRHCETPSGEVREHFQIDGVWMLPPYSRSVHPRASSADDGSSDAGWGAAETSSSLAAVSGEASGYGFGSPGAVVTPAKKGSSMPRKVKDVPSPVGLRRRIARAPIRLYHWHLGWLLGKRFLLLTHTGRTTGQPRQVVLEVAGYDARTDTYLVASGFGPRAQWYRNVRRNPAVTIQVGRRRTAAVASPLSAETSGRAMAEYASQHPRIAAKLMRVCGLEVDGTTEDFYVAGRDHVPFVRLAPATTRPRADSGGTHMNVRPLHGVNYQNLSHERRAGER